MYLGDLVWHFGRAHVVTDHRRRFVVELVRFGDSRKRTFWTLKWLVREFTWGDYKNMLGE